MHSEGHLQLLLQGLIPLVVDLLSRTTEGSLAAQEELGKHLKEAQEELLKAEAALELSTSQLEQCRYSQLNLKVREVEQVHPATSTSQAGM